MDTLLISFANQKGGVGKSTLTSVYANYLSNKGDKSVVVCDCDDLQQTLVNKRERDKGNGIDASDMYDILAIKSSDFEKQYTSLFKGNVDVCFLDLPGNLMQSGVIASYFHADVLIIPTSLSSDDIDSTLKFYSKYTEKVLPLRKGLPLVKIIGVLNKVDKSSLEYKEFIKQKAHFPIKFMENVLPQAPVTFQRNSTTISDYTMNKKTKGEEIDIVKTFCEELDQLIF